MKNPFFKTTSFAIDIGNNNTVLSDGAGTCSHQASFIVFESETNRIRAVGDEAYDIFERTPQELRAVKPLKWGVIADYDSASAMIRKMVAKTFTGTRFFPRYNEIISGVPYCSTEVERRALREALDQFNARDRYLLFEPLAAALGMGLNIREPDGKMIVDIGGGITEIVIISLSGIAVFKSVKTAGDTFTEDIRDHLRKEYNFQIGWKTAELIKRKAGAVMDQLKENPEPMLVKGKDLMEGIPAMRSIDHRQVSYILNKSMRAIEEQILQALQICPPELAADIYKNGIHVTGGGSMLRGMKERLERIVQLTVHVDPDPLWSVSRGISRALSNTKSHRAILIK